MGEITPGQLLAVLVLGGVGGAVAPPAVVLEQSSSERWSWLRFSCLKTGSSYSPLLIFYSAWSGVGVSDWVVIDTNEKYFEIPT